jgi:hypothetical protein
MKIASSEMQMVSSHASLQRDEVRESLRLWAGAQGPNGEGRASASPAGERVTLSDAGRAAQSADAGAVASSRGQMENDPRLLFLRSIIFLLTGEEARVFDPASLTESGDQPATPEAGTAASPTGGAARERAAGAGVEYDYHASHSESEQTSFSARGVVRTQDGQEIRFAVDLSMSRSYHEESNVSLRLADTVRQQKDPLVVNFAGQAAQLSEQRFAFDLDADGTTDSVNRLVSGSGFLALDRNRDGRINNGSELFGTTSGDGFADLAALDDDGNGWIDENDPAYSRLSVWTPDANGGGALRGLKEADVGALALARVATPFELRSQSNEALGQIRSSGIFLQESGGIGSLQQVDLSV